MDTPDKPKESNVWIAVICIVAAAIYYFGWHAPKEEKRQLARQKQAAADLNRQQQGARLIVATEFAPGQVISTVVIPGKYGVDIFDTKCIVYTHTEFKQSNMVCPGATQGDLDLE